MADTLTPAMEAAFDRLDASMEASFDRIDALLAQILNRFQGRINSLEHKISLDLQDRHPVVVSPQTHSDDAICNGFQQRRREATSLDCKHVLKSCDLVYGFHVSNGVSVPTATSMAIDAKFCFDVKKAPLCTAVIAYDELMLQTHIGDEIGDGFKRRREPTSPACPLLHSEVAEGLHALHPFVEMQHSGALCHGNAILGFDLSYYMGIRDKGGGFEVLQKELHHQGNIKNCLVVIFLDFGSLHTFIDLSLVKGLSWPIAHIHQFDFLRSNFLLANSGMVLSHGCSQVRFRVQDYGCVDDFELSSHMGIRDKGSGFIGWIWRTDLRWLRKQHGLQCFHVYTIWNCCGLCLWRFCGRQFQLALCILGRADSRKFLEPNESWRYAFWGDLVYLRLIPYQHKSLASHPFHELQPKFYGPYGILDKVGSVAYKLKLPPNSKLYSYDIPHTCSPEPAICCQFNFARMRGFMYELCPWGEHPVETNQENVQERALILLDQYRKKSTLYRTNTLLIPLGGDFRYISIDEAEAQFRNYQMLFDYINSNPGLNTEAKFGTLEDYFWTLREEAERINHSLPGEIGSGQVGGFPSLSGDFFTYADRQQDYWSGYYVSRPFFKAVDRVLEQTLRTTDMMMAFLLGYCQRAQCEKLPMGFSYKLAAARRNLALFQHHDGVTGTAKDHVVLDYGTRMHTSLQDLQIFMSKAIEVLLGIRHEKNDNNPSQFEPEQVRSKYDVQPVHRAIMAREGTKQSVVFFNPLGQTREEVVMLIVNRPDVTVLDSNWTCVQSQISPELQHDKSKIFTGRHRVYWKASVPALGLQTYYIANGFVGCEKAKPAKLRLFSKSMSISCPTPYACSKAEVDVAEIQNRHQILTFDVNHGLLQKISYKNGSQNVVGEEIAMYSSWGSGAYLFKPNGDAQPIIEAGGQMVISEGPLVQEVYSYPKTAWEKSPISHSTRIYNGENTVQEFLIEKEYHVELLSQDFNDMELIVRYKTDIDNKRIFFSDLNGFQMSRRETYDKIPTQGNYYPMPSLAFMQGSNGQRFSVHSRQSLGVASLRNGWLEIMLDRRLVKDDGRGLGQGVMDNRAMNVVFHIVVESNISATSNPVSNPLPLSPSLLSHRVNAHLNYPLHAFIAKKPEELSVQPPPRFFSPLAAPLPCDLHIVSFKVPQPLKYSQQPIGDSRFVLILQRQNWDSSYCRRGRSGCTRFADETVNLFYMFKELSVLNARATSLNLLHEDTDMLGYTEQFGDVAQDGHVLISPMEVQAYKLELRPHK